MQLCPFWYMFLLVSLARDLLGEAGTASATARVGQPLVLPFMAFVRGRLREQMAHAAAQVAVTCPRIGLDAFSWHCSETAVRVTYALPRHVVRSNGGMCGRQHMWGSARFLQRFCVCIVHNRVGACTCLGLSSSSFVGNFQQPTLSQGSGGCSGRPPDHRPDNHHNEGAHTMELRALVRARIASHPHTFSGECRSSLADRWGDCCPTIRRGCKRAVAIARGVCRKSARQQRKCDRGLGGERVAKARCQALSDIGRRRGQASTPPLHSLSACTGPLARTPRSIFRVRVGPRRFSLRWIWLGTIANIGGLLHSAPTDMLGPLLCGASRVTSLGGAPSW